MKVAISGSNGYIASKFIQKLDETNHAVVRLNRSSLNNVAELRSLISGTDAVINLAGSPIFTRWTESNKKTILNSRVQSTTNIVKAINSLPPEKKPKLFISASAIGIYKQGHFHTEANNILGDDFVSSVVKSWELATEGLDSEVRRVIIRIGLVLGKEAKTIQNLLPLFKWGLGGKLGSGKQPFPFIHIDDVVNAMLWCIANEQAIGIYNLVAPQQINNKQFTRAFAQAIHRLAIFTVPAIALRLILGKTSSLLLQNPEVYPERLINQGFTFSYPEIAGCLNQIVKPNKI